MEGKKRRYQMNNYGTTYVDGSTVRKLNAHPVRREEQHQVPTPRKQERRQPRALSGMDFASLLVLVAAIAATLFVCVDYLNLRSQASQMDKEIRAMEQKLANMINENDAAYNYVNQAYDLEYVYEIAVGEFGMVYPNNNQVITYERSPEDYVRQYADIPQ